MGELVSTSNPLVSIHQNQTCLVAGGVFCTVRFTVFQRAWPPSSNHGLRMFNVERRRRWRQADRGLALVLASERATPAPSPVRS